jgi:vacuolar protein sorting-associated protein 35
MRPSKPPPEPALTPAEEQEKWLHEATTAVKQHAFYMKRAIDDSNLKDALKHSSVMLSELRTSRLSPQKYYALFMRACDEMRYLEGFFSDLAKSGRRCERGCYRTLRARGGGGGGDAPL